ncbi:hypothetical protein GOP47_0001440 [Adiantum capillus-veneris]|uniref:Uncharacterized protein n=1 Tax=Adiantum capillus-veneris TaxID=13818 RepID=A0A9D4ZQ10_ADICA|nr:hypothetical protein GOP47_0001440 [Adiantum capillus-veneris]
MCEKGGERRAVERESTLWEKLLKLQRTGFKSSVTCAIRSQEIVHCGDRAPANPWGLVGLSSDASWQGVQRAAIRVGATHAYSCSTVGMLTGCLHISSPALKLDAAHEK